MKKTNPDTVPAIVDHWAELTPDAIAVRSGGTELTYQALHRAMEHSARKLQTLGVGPGDRVVLVGNNSWQWVAVFLGTLRLGAIVAPANTRLSPKQFAAQSNSIGATVVIADRALHAITSDTTNAVVSLDGPGGFEAIHVDSEQDLGPLPSAADAAILSFTSGTTGVPKGAVLTHDAYFRGSAVFAETMGLSNNDSTLVLVPLFHNTGFVDQLGQMLVVGGRTDLLNKFGTARAANLLAEHPVSYITAVPSIVRLLMLHEAADRVFRDTRTILYGGSPMPEAWTRELAERFPAIRLFHGYGLTEFTSACTLLSPDRAADHPESVGTPVAGVALRVVGDDGNDVPVGETGEIWVAGPTRMTEYWGLEDKTAEKIVGKWLRTGDLGFVTDGLLFLSGRIDDVINRGGEKVLPSFVESVLCQRPDIAEVCVFGVPDPVLQLRVHAAVKPREGSDYDEAAARTLLRDRLPDYAIPEVIHVVDDFPRGASGKVDRKSVSAQYIQASEPIEETL